MIKDSGDRTEFETGAKRDMHAGKGRMDLLLLRWMLRCPECKKVTVVNWKEFINE